MRSCPLTKGIHNGLYSLSSAVDSWPWLWKLNGEEETQRNPFLTASGGQHTEQLHIKHKREQGLWVGFCLIITVNVQKGNCKHLSLMPHPFSNLHLIFLPNFIPFYVSLFPEKCLNKIWEQCKDFGNKNTISHIRCFKTDKSFLFLKDRC